MLELKQVRRARAVGALIVWPDVAYDDAEKRTDWNDIHCTDGLDRVQRDVAQAKLLIQGGIDNHG